MGFPTWLGDGTAMAAIHCSAYCIGVMPVFFLNIFWAVEF